MNRFHALAIIPLAALLSGCGSIYYAPKSSSTATLRFTNDSTIGEAGAGIYDNPHCIGGSAMGFSAIGRGQFRDYQVDAGNALNFLVDGDRGSEILIQGTSLLKADIRRCQAPGRFLPVAGGKYEVVYRDNGSQCEVEVFEIASGVRRPMPFQKLQYGKAPPDNPKGNCAPQGSEATR